VPLTVSVWGLLLALLVMVKEAERVPSAAGVKLTLMVQFAPAATEPPQLSFSLKSPGLVPPTVMGGV